jgi:hypothetical protein
MINATIPLSTASPPARIVRGYHGTSAIKAARIVRQQTLESSENGWDWIGHGIYFWEGAPGRAWEWARKHHGSESAVVAVDIMLGACLDLTDVRFTSILQVAYHQITELYSKRAESAPENRGKARYLDCLVINYVCEEILETIDTVRATFIEGDPVYPGSGFMSQSHIQICVRNVSSLVSAIKLETPR